MWWNITLFAIAFAVAFYLVVWLCARRDERDQQARWDACDNNEDDEP